MRHVLSLFERFRRDERGAFAVIFAVMAIVLVAMSGAVVDFTSMQQSRTKAQVALDASALALQPQIYNETPQQVQTSAQALLLNRLADATTVWQDCGATGTSAPPPCAHIDTPVFDTTNGSLTMTADVKVPMNFVSLVGVNSLTAQIQSEATRQKLNLEVAMVLDNSGSMSTQFGSGRNSTRLTVLQDSANCAANILFYGVSDCDTSVAGKTKNPDVKMALVPFNDEVNVGYSNANADWIDRTGGNNTYDNDNFDSDNNAATPYTAKPADRINMFTQIKQSNGTALKWAGCVEARREDGSTKNYDTDDTLPTPGDPDSMFVPLFAPDEPDTSYTITTTSTGKHGTTSTVNTYSYPNSYLSDTPSQCPALANGATDRVRQERLCKYNTSNKMTKSASPANGFGPNADCPASAILPLTDDPSSLTNAINAMQAMGNTNIQEGAAWGWRTLSPTEPFTEGDDYGTSTSKVMIIMTDGENTFNSVDGTNTNINGATLYASYGYPYNNYDKDSRGGESAPARGRMGDIDRHWQAADYETAINQRLALTCANAKLAGTDGQSDSGQKGIVIFTIGLATSATSDPTGNKKLLTDCASTPDDAYFPKTADDLTQAFVDIANQLAALRLAK